MITKEELISLGVENLANIILTLQVRDPEIPNTVKARVAALNSDPKDLIAKIEEGLSKFQKKFERYKELEDEEDEQDKKYEQMRSELVDLCSLIGKVLLLKSPKKAFELMTEFLNLSRYVEQDYRFINVFTSACTDLGEISSRFDQPQSDIVDMVFNLFVNKTFYCKNIILDFKSSFNAEGSILLREKLENYHNPSLKSDGLKAVADVQDNVDAYIHACGTTDGDLKNDVIIAIVQRLIKHNRYDEGLTWIDKIQKNSYCFRNTVFTVLQNDSCVEATKLKAQILDLTGQPQKAQEVRIERFKSTLNTSLYQDILSHGDPDFVVSFKQEAGKQAIQYQCVKTAVTFLTTLGDSESLNSLVYAKHNHLYGGTDYYLMKRAAEMLRDTDYPLSATLLFRDLIDAMLDRGRTTAYKYGIRYIRDCEKLSENISNWYSIPTHDTYIASLREKHGRKRNFWSGLGFISFSMH